MDPQNRSGSSGRGRGDDSSRIPGEGTAAHPEIETQVIQSVNKPIRKNAGLLLEFKENKRVELG